MACTEGLNSSGAVSVHKQGKGNWVKFNQCNACTQKSPTPGPGSDQDSDKMCQPSKLGK